MKFDVFLSNKGRCPACLCCVFASLSWFMYITVCIVCRKGVLDPKIPANRDTGWPGQAIEFLAAGHKTSNQFSLEYWNNSEEFRRIQKIFRQNLDVFRQNLKAFRWNLRKFRFFWTEFRRIQKKLRYNLEEI